MLLHGIFPPITTPFYPDGSVCFQKLAHNVERYSRTPAAGLLVLGSTGEAVLLSDAERHEVLKSAREAAAAHQVLIAGTGMESAAETLRLTEYAAGLGYDVALVRTPHFYRDQMNRPDNMLAFYRFVADRSPLPVLIYNFPQVTGYDIPAEIVIELAEHPNVAGIKESGGSVAKVQRMVEGTRHVRRTVLVTADFRALTPRMLQSQQAAAHTGDIVPAGGLQSSAAAVSAKAGFSPSKPKAGLLGTPLKTRQKEAGFQVVVGFAQKFPESLQAGAVGGVLAFADAAPMAMFEVYAAWKDGDMELARQKQQRVAAAAARIAGELSIPGVKYACDLNGYYGGPVRLPLLALTADLRSEVEGLMGNIKS
jgi:dihydrodipicolinate synthase/N-acetylneuraminate lyase